MGVRSMKERLLVRVEREVRARLSARRLRHVVGTVRTAARLARRHGIDPARARLAAWLHDAAKETPLAGMRRALRGTPYRWDAGERRIPGLRHPKAGAAMGYHWGVRDAGVLRAAANHTLGRPGMDALETLLFVADYIEPGRACREVRRARRAASRDLLDAALAKAEATLSYLGRRGGAVHPRLVQTRDWILRRRSRGTVCGRRERKNP